MFCRTTFYVNVNDIFVFKFIAFSTFEYGCSIPKCLKSIPIPIAGSGIERVSFRNQFLTVVFIKKNCERLG